MKLDAATAWYMHGHHHVTSACCLALYSLWQLQLHSGHDCHPMLTSWGCFLELGVFWSWESFPCVATLIFGMYKQTRLALSSTKCPMLLHVCVGERRKRGKGDRRATELTTVIRNCLEQTIMLELMAGSQIDVFVQVLQVR